MDEEIDELISAVHSYSPLWDMKDKRYHSRDIQRKLWTKVAVEMGCDVASVEKKWKGLRDSFRREHKKFLKSGQEAPDEFVSSWPFFEQILFLSDIMHPRELKGNVSPLANDTLGADDFQDTQSMREHHEYTATDQGNSNACVAPVETGPPSLPDEQESAKKEVETKKTTNKKANTMNHDDPSNTNRGMSKETNKVYSNSAAVTPVEIRPLLSTPTSGKRKRAEMKTTSNTKGIAKAEFCDAELWKTEREKLQLFYESITMKSDSEYQFLMSLLPHLKRVPQNRQLSVRNKIQQVLIDEERHSSIQHQSPVPYASPSNVVYPPSRSSWISGPGTRLNSDVTSPSFWTSDEQPDAPPLSSRWDCQPEQTLNNTGQSQPNGSQAHDDLLNLMNNVENSFLTL